MLTVITGPMFAGKSSKLLSIARANLIAGKRVGYFKPKRDDRDGDVIATHDGVSVECNVASNSANLYEKFRKYDVFCIDEAQFFDSQSLIQFVTQAVYFSDKEVVISGLSQDSDGRPFGAMPHLLAIADDIIHLKAVCSSTLEIGAATRTYRKDKSNTNQVAVGGIEMYEPRSFKSWLKA